MGVVESQIIVDDAVASMRSEFDGDRYNLLSRNCNNFSDEFCVAVLNKRIPGWVNRMAYMGSWFSCLIPPQMLGEAPVNESGSGRSDPGYQMIGGGGRRAAGSQNSYFQAFGGSGTSLGSSKAPENQTDGNVRDRVRQARLAALQRNDDT